MKAQLPPFNRSRRPRSGIALISVLAIVVLLTALTVAFLMRAGAERQSSGFYNAESGARGLADTVVNLVQAQINEATGQGTSVAWASQPGAIRTFDNSGNLKTIYRLYSASSLTATSFSGLANDVPSSGSTWLTQPAYWVDLNAPVNNDPAQAPINTHFPILDPRDPSDVTLKKTVPMDGFSITNAPVDTTSTTNIDTNLTADPAPMPVQWLYVLQNGSIIIPDAGGNGRQLTFASATAQPSATNPIIGRVAFWTDDETCKINVNTAGGDGNIIPAATSLTGKADPSIVANRAYWAEPNFWSSDDAVGNVAGTVQPCLASAQPASGEYQRYPGHPATVALNEVLSTLLYGTSGTSIASNLFYGNPGVSTVTGLTPRYSYGGSLGGTVNNNAVATGDGTTFFNNNALTVAASSSRLYPSVGELLFNTDRTASPLNTANATARQRMETARFFLTAHSRAPELNLFGLPRISMWPLPDQSTGAPSLSPVDTLIQFCSTIGSKAYYFVRRTTNSGSTSGSVDSTIDIGIARNQSVLGYLANLTSTAIPGFGGAFSTKNYGSSASPLTGQNTQIINEIFDYVRITNVVDTSGSATVYGQPRWQGNGGEGWGYNQIAPSIVSGSSTLGWNTQGEGSYPRLVEVTLQFVAMGQGGNKATGANAIPVNPAEVGSPNVAFGQGDSSTTLTYAYVPITSGTTSTPTAALPYTPPGDTATHPQGSPAVQVTDASPSATASSYNTVQPSYNKITQVLNTAIPSSPGVVGTPAAQNSGIPPDGTTAVQAFLLFTFVNPAESWLVYTPYIWVNVTGISSFSLNSHSLGFTDNSMICASGQDWEGGGRSGYIPMFCNTQHYGFSKAGGDPLYTNPFYSNIIPINNTSAMSFGGSTVTIKVYDGPGTAELAYSSGGVPASTPASHQVQTYTINIPSASFPVPTIPAGSTSGGSFPAIATLVAPTYSNPNNNPNPGPPASGTFPNAYGGGLAWLRPTVVYGTSGSGSSSTVVGYETTGPIMYQGNPSGTYVPAAYYQYAPSLDKGGFWAGYQGPYNGASMIGPGDVVESMVLSKNWSDPRLLAVNTVPTAAWTTHPNWGTQMAHNLFWGMVSPLPGNGTTSSNSWGTGTWPTYPVVNGAKGSLAGNKVDTQLGAYPWAPPNSTDNGIPATVSGAPPDWDSGEAQQSDGPWINMPDEGSAEYWTGQANLPYYGNPVLPIATSSLFSANREVSSPGMFGSLPTGVDRTGLSPAPWQTLLFRPGPTGHPGGGFNGSVAASAPPYTSPPDHLWMDLFWMPVAEPYAISEPFSTAGKVNLNYQILPFTYIKRATALRAALATEKIAEVPLTFNSSYKNGMNGTYARFPVDLDTTMTQFDTKFANGDIFRSASQICEEYLVPGRLTYNPTVSPATPLATPQGIDYNSVSAFAADWYAPVTSNSSVAPFAMVGDNLRELPYAHMYGKVTTKSNTFTIYYRVQALKSPPTVAANAWDESQGSIKSEYRGSTTLERFIDPNEVISGGTATDFPDFATATMPASNLEGYYQWRVVENRQFTP